MTCDLAHCSHADGKGCQGTGESGDHGRDRAGGPPPAGHGRRGRGAVTARVARELDMVSSAVYRYVASRDDLLAWPMIEAYDVLGAVVEAASAPRAGADAGWSVPRRRARPVRTWAVAHPHEFALLYGSPVPGYEAPPDTIAPAARTTLALVGIVADAHRHGAAWPAARTQIPAGLHGDFETIGDAVAAAPPGPRDRHRDRGVVAAVRAGRARAERPDVERDPPSRRPVRRHPHRDGGADRPARPLSAAGSAGDDRRPELEETPEVVGVAPGLGDPAIRDAVGERRREHLRDTGRGHTQELLLDARVGRPRYDPVALGDDVVDRPRLLHRPDRGEQHVQAFGAFRAGERRSGRPTSSSRR